jgi:membrane-associated protease RseP (regulator of RpoE activity)
MPVAGNVGSGRCGVGLKLTQPSSKVNVTIDKIQKDSAADVSGRLKPGDVVVRVDGRSISDLEQAKELLIGQEGSQVAIEVARSEGGALRIFEVILTRKSLSIRRGDRGSLDPGNGYSSSTRDPKFQDARYYSSGGGGSSYDPWRDEKGTSNANVLNVSLNFFFPACCISHFVFSPPSLL